MPNESDEIIKRRQKAAIKSPFEKLSLNHGDFPNCKGIFPDCPNEPSLMNSMCRTCPKTDGIKKPKLNLD